MTRNDENIRKEISTGLPEWKPLAHKYYFST